jgi:cytochrome c556
MMLHVAMVGACPEEGATDAAPAIWRRWSKFEAKSHDLQTHSEGLVAAGRSGGTAAMRDGLAGVTDACAACHKLFRIR